ncbi:hypothetical protein HY933_04700 [Candidatus Falkowbacteria bacterium]|nr:hypothetical protein [Candidatus Falkowbacteria bacterium]
MKRALFLMIAVSIGCTANGQLAALIEIEHGSQTCDDLELAQIAREVLQEQLLSDLVTQDMVFRAAIRHYYGQNVLDELEQSGGAFIVLPFLPETMTERDYRVLLSMSAIQRQTRGKYRDVSVQIEQIKSWRRRFCQQAHLARPPAFGDGLTFYQQSWRKKIIRYTTPITRRKSRMKKMQHRNSPTGARSCGKDGRPE